MKSIRRLLAPLYRQRAGGLALALLLTAITLAAGVGLLGVSGWFLTGAALVASWQTFNLFAPSALVRGLSFVRIVSRYFERVVGHDTTLRLLADLRGTIFRRLLPLDAGQLAKYRDGDLIARLTGDVDALDTVYLFAIAPVISGLVIGLILSLVVGAWLPAAGLLLLICLFLGTVLVPLYLAKKARLPGIVVQQNVAIMRDTAVQAVTAHADLIALGAQSRAQRDFAAQCLQVSIARRRQSFLASNGKAIVQILSGISLLAMLYWGSEGLNQGVLSGPVWAGLVLAVLGIFEVFGPIMRGASRLGSAAAAAKRIEALTEAKAIIVDSEQTQELPLQGSIIFNNVRYAYPTSDGQGKGREVLKGINLQLQVGERIAIIGKSGAGKSSLLNLLLRFDDPDQGEITYAGVDLRQAALAQLHQRIAFLTQDAPVFLGTIRSNLLIAEPQADDESLWQALDNARLGDFVRSLPEGLNTWTGETGRTLSAGQARRLCLARALLSPAHVLVLDEPTQGLDRDAEQAFIADLIVATRGRTVIMVTHAQLPDGAVDSLYKLQDGQLI
ncbi:MAG: thiol reductant ABC exporter subunit CydC [Alcaligenaceae bacterium]|nr:thiol reductant ABC exporter subunit CydC [Alcaligenaceae bacterium]